jgi:small subunit ribosomal protein S10
MPVVKEFVDDPGCFYVSAAVEEQPVTFQLAAKGELYLTQCMKLSDGSHFDLDVLVRLLKRRWAHTDQPGSEPLLRRQRPKAAHVSKIHDVMLTDRHVAIRFESTDVGKLDAAVSGLVQALLTVHANLAGPYPLPTRREHFGLISASGRREYCVRTHKRLLIILAPLAEVIQRAASYNIPLGVNVKMKEEAKRVTASVECREGGVNS